MPDSFDDFLDALAHGSDAEIGSFVYRGERLSESARQVCAGILTHHCRASQTDGRLLEKSRHASGKFLLLIVCASWQDDVEDNYTPLIITLCESQVKVAGVVMPFDDLAQLKKEEYTEIGELTATWIIRKMQVR